MDAQTAESEAGRIDAREASLSDFGQWTSRDLFDKPRRFKGFLKDWHERDFDRYMLPVLEYRGGKALVGSHDGRGADEVAVFCSADYLGLAHDPVVVAAAAAALNSHGASVSSVPAIAGTTDLHRVLEQQLAALTGTEACVLFPTGHAANIGTIGALCGPRDLVVVDKQIHYSFIEGIKTAGCRWESFRHSDPDHLAHVLERALGRRSDRGVLVAVEGVYGVDGDMAPLAELQTVAARFGARLMVDDAHATGVIGPHGAGTAGRLGLKPPDIVMGSLSKSLGSFGGWIATDQATADFLRYFAKSIVFSVGLPAAQAAAASAALERIGADHTLLERLHQNRRHFSEGVETLQLPRARISGSAIHSVLIGSEPLLRDVVRDLFHEGVWAEGLPVPAVARGEERLRFRVRACHEIADIEHTVEATGRVLRRHRLIAERIVVPARLIPVEADRRRSEAGDVVKLQLECARRRAETLSWVNQHAQRRILDGVPPWDSVADSRRIFIEYDSGEPVASAVAYVTQAQTALGLRSVGLIGDIASLPGHLAQASAVVQRAAAWLYPLVKEVLAPAQPPLQVRGGGIREDGEQGGKPFLEPTVNPEIADVLRQAGLPALSSHTYTLHRLEPTCRLQPQSAVPGLTVKPFERTDFRNAILELHPVFQDTVAMLPLCSPLDPFSFLGIASELRELILPDLWQVARRNGRVVGFAGGFPNVTDAFRAAQGVAGVADVELIRLALDNTRQGFLAWVAVEPSEEAPAIGLTLVDAVLAAMRRMGMNSVWLSWEVVAGALSATELRKQLGPPLTSATYQLYGAKVLA